MSQSKSRELSLRFLCDEHVNRPAVEQLRLRAIDIVHVTEVGLAGEDDLVVFRWAQREGRIIVTRNYRDFAPLVEALAGRRECFPGVLFCSTSVHQGDVNAHVRALASWIASAVSTGTNPLENSYGWLSRDLS